MTEDDTFRILKKLPFGVVWKKYSEWHRDEKPYTIIDLERFCLSMGWTYDELFEYKTRTEK